MLPKFSADNSLQRQYRLYVRCRSLCPFSPDHRRIVILSKNSEVYAGFVYYFWLSWLDSLPFFLNVPPYFHDMHRENELDSKVSLFSQVKWRMESQVASLSVLRKYWWIMSIVATWGQDNRGRGEAAKIQFGIFCLPLSSFFARYFNTAFSVSRCLNSSTICFLPTTLPKFLN